MADPIPGNLPGMVAEPESAPDKQLEDSSGIKDSRWNRLTHEALGKARFEDDDVKMERLIKLFQREVNKGYIFRELIPYCLFLLFMLVIVMVSRSEQYQAGVHRTVEGIQGVLINGNFKNTDDLRFKKTFWDISNVDDWYDWMEYPLAENFWQDIPQNNTPRGKLVTTYNKPLGYLVLRQQRVQRERCRQEEAYNAIAPLFRNFLPVNCYPEYQCTSVMCNLETAPYGPNNSFTSEQANGFSYPPISGKIHDYNYGSRSYAQVFPTDDISLANITARLKELRRDNWIDAATRMVSAEFILLNRNYDVFVWVAAFAEINAGGLWVPQVRTVPFRFLTVQGGATAICIFILDIIVTIYFMYIFYRICQGVYRHYKLHNEILSFFGFWNTYALGDMILFMVTYGYRWSFWHITLQLSKDEFFSDDRVQQDTADMWSTMARYGVLYETSWNLYGFACALAIGGLFRFTQYNPRLFLLVETVERALGELLSVTLMMSIVVFAYGLLGHILFGYYLDEFQSFVASCGTLLRFLIGDYFEDAFYSMRDAQNNTSSAVIFFGSYMFIAWCILLNMILAIITESLTAVKQKAGQQDIQIMKFLQKMSRKLQHKCCHDEASETRERRRSLALEEDELKKRKMQTTREVYEKLKQYRSGPFFREKMLKQDLRETISWTIDEWEFLEEFMLQRRQEVYDKEADTPERQRLEMIHEQLRDVMIALGVNKEDRMDDKVIHRLKSISRGLSMQEEHRDSAH